MMFDGSKKQWEHWFMLDSFLDVLGAVLGERLLRTLCRLA